MNVTFYSKGCPKCNVLQKKLDQKNVEYTKTDEITLLIDKGFKTLPILEVDGEYMKFNEAIKWINTLED